MLDAEQSGKLCLIDLIGGSTGTLTPDKRIMSPTLTNYTNSPQQLPNIASGLYNFVDCSQFPQVVSSGRAVSHEIRHAPTPLSFELSMF